MKIKSELKVGSLLTDAGNYSSRAAAAIPRFVEKAGQQASGIVDTAMNTSSKLWGSLSSWINSI